MTMSIKKALNQHKILIAVFIAAVAVTALSALYVTSHGYAQGENPISGINESRSQILVTGQNYSLNHEQEQQYLEEEQKREELRNQELAVQQTGDLGQDSSQWGIDDTGEGSGSPGSSGGESPSPGKGDGDKGDEGSGGNTGGDEEESKLPVIKSSLSEVSRVDGNYLTFTVEATSYKKVKLSSFNINVLVNGSRISSSGTSNKGVVTYRADGALRDGANEVSITATDEEGYTATKVYNFDVDINGERPEGGKVSFVVDAPSIGLGTIYRTTATFYEGENAAGFIDRTLKSAGFSLKTTGSVAMGYYVARLNKPGISGGWQINEAAKKRLDDMNADENGPPESEDTLGEQDFYKYSGWVYAVNGEYPDGMATFNLQDGDEIRLSFTLWMGYEYDGTWPECRL